MRIVSLALALLTLTATRAGATEIYRYLVEGSLTVNGNNACGGPCLEKLDFSFQLEYVKDSFGSWAPVWLSSANVTAVGPLSGFTVPEPFGRPTYVPFFNAAGDEIDLSYSQTTFLPTDPTVAPTFSLVNLWGCRSEACWSGFVPADWGAFSQGAHAFNLPVWGTAEVTSRRVAMPEGGSTLVMLGLGLGGVALIRRRRRSGNTGDQQG
jgi:hypothetical protein